MKKRLITSILSVSMVMALITGCGNAKTAETVAGATDSLAVETSAGESVNDTAASGEPVTITILCGYAGEDPHGQYIYQYAEDFMSENPNIKVDIQAISTNDIYTKLAAMATTPKDLPVMFFTSADSVATLYDLGLTQDLTGLVPQDLKDGLANGVLDACTIDNQMIYYPVVVQPQAVIYRKDRFEEAGLEIPTTWAEFVADAKALTKDLDSDGQVDEWGFSMIGSNNSSGQSRFMSYLWSNGFDLVYQEDGADEWKTDITSDAKFVDTFSVWTDMNVEGIVPTGITEVDYPTSANYFAMGYTSMFLTGPNALGVAYSSNPDLKGKLGSFKVPGDYPGTMLGAEGYAISSYASEAQQAAAVEFLGFFTQHDTDMQFWQSSGKIPATIEGQKAEYITGEDYEGFLDQISQGCRPTMSFAGVSGLKSALGDAYASVFSEEENNEKAVSNLVKAIDELLEDYN